MEFNWDIERGILILLTHNNSTPSKPMMFCLDVDWIDKMNTSEKI
jgi:hypothetical protein